MELTLYGGDDDDPEELPDAALVLFATPTMAPFFSAINTLVLDCVRLCGRADVVGRLRLWLPQCNSPPTTVDMTCTRMVHVYSEGAGQTQGRAVVQEY